MGKDKVVISIGRQYGSGGREIGRRLAEIFNIKFYDKELILSLIHIFKKVLRYVFSYVLRREYYTVFIYIVFFQ